MLVYVEDIPCKYQLRYLVTVTLTHFSPVFVSMPPKKKMFFSGIGFTLIHLHNDAIMA